VMFLVSCCLWLAFCFSQPGVFVLRSLDLCVGPEAAIFSHHHCSGLACSPFSVRSSVSGSSSSHKLGRHSVPACLFFPLALSRIRLQPLLFFPSSWSACPAACTPVRSCASRWQPSAQPQIQFLPPLRALPDPISFVWHCVHPLSVVWPGLCRLLSCSPI
jgi:hypothetical protein